MRQRSGAAPVLMCAVCKRQVDSVTRSENRITREDIYVVMCHGATQEVALSYETIVQAERIEMGEAFTTPELPAAPAVRQLPGRERARD